MGKANERLKNSSDSSCPAVPHATVVAQARASSTCLYDGLPARSQGEIATAESTK